MINPRSIASLGVGFGVLAMATLGIVADTQAQPQQPADTYSYSSGGSPIQGTRKKKPDITAPLPALCDDDEIVLMLALLEL